MSDASSLAPTPTSQLRPHFSRTREAAGLVFVSGQLPFDPSQTIVSGDVTDQTRQCLRNIATLLAAEGLGLADVVKTTVWLSRTQDFQAFDATYGAMFEGMTLPSRSTVRADLMVPGALVEIEAVAARA